MLEETLKIFYSEGDIIEIRVIGRITSSGYFNDIKKAAAEAKKYDGKGNVYFVLNKINPACYHRENRDRIIDKATNTSDTDIERREWILLDFDPIRASKTSATDKEKKLAEELEFERTDKFYYTKRIYRKDIEALKVIEIPQGIFSLQGKKERILEGQEIDDYFASITD